MQIVFRIRDLLKKNEHLFLYTNLIKIYVIRNRVDVVYKLTFSDFVVHN